MQVHPVADLFPMLSEGELADLAEDIKANGLNFPIVLDAKGETLIDGRNRLKACELAGVKPRFERLNGQDPRAYIISNNVKRRHLNAGQTAILLARAYPERDSVGGRSQKGGIETYADSAQVSLRLLTYAYLIEDYAPELGDQVLAKLISFEEARLKARDRKAEAETNAEKMARLKAEAPDLADLAGISLAEAIATLEQRKADKAKLDLIRDASPDLVALVEEGRMSVMDAMAAHDKRVEADRHQRESATNLVATIVRLISIANGGDPKAEAERLAEKFDPHLWPADELGDPSPELFEASGRMLRAFAVRLREQSRER
jgi:hypothetical protein